MVPCVNFEKKNFFSHHLQLTTTNSKTKASATDWIFFTNDFIQIAIKNKNIYSVLRLMIKGLHVGKDVHTETTPDSQPCLWSPEHKCEMAVIEISQ